MIISRALIVRDVDSDELDDVPMPNRIGYRLRFRIPQEFSITAAMSYQPQNIRPDHVGTVIFSSQRSVTLRVPIETLSVRPARHL